MINVFVKHRKNSYLPIQSLVCLVLLWIMNALPVAAHAAKVTMLEWLPPELHSQEYWVKARLKFQSSPSEPSIHDKLSITLITKPYQHFIVCSEEMDTDNEDPVSMVQLSHSPPANTFSLTSRNPQTNLTLKNPCHSPQASLGEYPYQIGQYLFSDQPILAIREGNKKNRSRRSPSSSGLSGDIFQPKSDFDNSLGSGGGYWPDDDNHNKRPGWMPYQTSSDWSMDILPILRLDWNWDRELSGDDPRHWLFGSRDDQSGLRLRISINELPGVSLPLSAAQYNQLIKNLGSTQQLLQWLKPILSGQTAFIEYLLETAEGLTKEEDEIQAATIAHHLSTAIEMPDQFNLDFEVRQLCEEMDAMGLMSKTAPAGWPDEDKIYSDNKISRLFYQAPNGQKAKGGAEKVPQKKHGGGSETISPPKSKSAAAEGFSGKSGATVQQATKDTDSDLNKQGEVTIFFYGETFEAVKADVENFLGYNAFEIKENLSKVIDEFKKNPNNFYKNDFWNQIKYGIPSTGHLPYGRESRISFAFKCIKRMLSDTEFFRDAAPTALLVSVYALSSLYPEVIEIFQMHDPEAFLKKIYEIDRELSTMKTGSITIVVPHKKPQYSGITPDIIITQHQLKHDKLPTGFKSTDILLTKELKLLYEEIDRRLLKKEEKRKSWDCFRREMEEIFEAETELGKKLTEILIDAKSQKPGVVIPKIKKEVRQFFRQAIHKGKVSEDYFKEFERNYPYKPLLMSGPVTKEELEAKGIPVCSDGDHCIPEALVPFVTFVQAHPIVARVAGGGLAIGAVTLVVAGVVYYYYFPITDNEEEQRLQEEARHREEEARHHEEAQLRENQQLRAENRRLRQERDDLLLQGFDGEGHRLPPPLQPGQTEAERRAILSRLPTPLTPVMARADEAIALIRNERQDWISWFSYHGRRPVNYLYGLLGWGVNGDQAGQMLDEEQPHEARNIPAAARRLFLRRRDGRHPHLAFLECPVCFENARDTVLNCGHTFCVACCRRLDDRGEDGTPAHNPPHATQPCPTARCPITDFREFHLQP